jgi:hypothetical protein
VGLLDSLAQILPYAIPAAAGMALGGPGLGMVGAGGAAAAKAGALDKQMKLAEMMNESDYRNKDLGLRSQEIQSNEELRKQTLKQEDLQHQQAITEKYDALKQQAQNQANMDARDREFHADTLANQQETHALMAQAQAEHSEDKRDSLLEKSRESTTGQISRAQSMLASKAKEAWKHVPVAQRALALVGLGKDADYDDWEKNYVNTHLPQVLTLSGITPQRMAQQGFDPASIGDNFPNYNPMPAPGAAPAAAAGAPTAAPAIPPGAKPVYDGGGKLIGYRHD